MTGFSDSYLNELKRDLGRDVSQEWESCRDYIDVYNNHLDDIIKLLPITVAAIRYIRSILEGHGDIRNAMSFVENVVKKGGDVNEWVKKSYSPKFSSVGSLSKSVGRDISLEGGGCKDYSDVYGIYINDLRRIITRPMSDVVSKRHQCMGCMMFVLGKEFDIENAETFLKFVVEENMDFNEWKEKIYIEQKK